MIEREEGITNPLFTISPCVSNFCRMDLLQFESPGESFARAYFHVSGFTVQDYCFFFFGISATTAAPESTMTAAQRMMLFSSPVLGLAEP